MAFTPLNALNAYLEVARRRSFAAAARELGVSPSALSQSVRKLEARLGVSLLTRTSRSVALTDAGQRLLEHADPAVEQALESLKTVSVQPGEVTGRVRLDLNFEEFQRHLFDLDPDELRQVFKTFRKLAVMDWNTVYRDNGWPRRDHDGAYGKK